MDGKLIEKLHDCFSRTSTAEKDYSKACELIENNLNSIDFEDDDDAEEIFDLISSALSYEDDDRVEHPEVGVKFLEFLISKGFNINFKLLKKDCLILRLAETSIAPEIFQKVIDLGADVYSETSHGGNVLTRSASALFEEWYQPDFETSERLPVYIAEHFDLSRLDHSDENGITPLMYAVYNNKPNLVDVLLKRGSDVNLTGSDIMYGTECVSPFAAACSEGNYEIAKKLLDAGADETASDAEGTPALFYLLFSPRKNNAETVQKTEIISLLKNLDCCDSGGNTLLTFALLRNDYKAGKKVDPDDNDELICELLKCGANVNAQNNDGECALSLSALWNTSVLGDIVNAGADLNLQDTMGNTALHILCRHYNQKEARKLIRKGADFKIKNKDGKTALDLAVENGLADIVELMV